MNFLDEALKDKNEIIELRRDFHRHPELGFQEVRTSKIVADRLRSLGLEVTTGVAKTGVVAMLNGAARSPVILLRFDMDALPIQEQNDVDYVSEHPGKMHACGHDGHVAIGLSVAKLLAAKGEQLPGTIKFVFQPAEEGDGGAKQMVAEGVLENPKPDFVMGVHVWNEKPVGEYALTVGPVMAGGDIFSVKVMGKGGHGAAPHKCVDPLAAATQIITALQTIMARNVNPLESAVLSVCTMNAGSAFNIIPHEVTFSGTIRTFKPQVFARVTERFNDIVQNIATAMNCDVDIRIERVTYPVVNDAEMVRVMSEVTQQVDKDAVIDSAHQTMGSEDFSYLMQDIPGCFIFVGSSNPGKSLDFGHHHPKFDFDEDCLPYAAAILAEGTLRLLEKYPVLED